MEVNKVDTEAAAVALVVVKVDKLATPAVVTVTCQEIAPRDKNATTVEKLVT